MISDAADSGTRRYRQCMHPSIFLSTVPVAYGAARIQFGGDMILTDMIAFLGASV